MAATVCPPPKFVGLDNSGNPLSSGKLYSYLAGTSTPAATYSDSDLTTPNANPTILDAGGRASVYLSATSYKFVLKSSADATIYTQDNVISSAPYNVDLDVPITAGEALTSGQAIYLSDGTGARTAGRWYLTDSDTAAYSTLPITGFVTTDVASGATGSVRLLGEATVPGALSVGSTYYLSGTPGALSTSAGTFAKAMGVADSATTLIMTVQQTVSSTGNLLVSGTLTVTGATALQSTLAVTGATTLSSTLASGALTVTGAATVSTTLGVTGATTLSSTVATGALTVTGNETVSGTLAIAGATTLTGGLNTPLVVAQGGTGLATLTANNVLLGNGSSTPSFVAPSTTGNVLTSNGTTWASTAVAQQALGTAEGRLTLTTGTPVTTADVTAATTMYYSPYIGNKIALYDGSATWAVYSFTELSLALGTLTASLPYDVFAYNNAGTVTLEFLAWTNATTRATALTQQNGVYVKTGATTRRYLGTFYTTATTTTEDSARQRLVWNMYNRVTRQVKVFDATSNWTYATATWRQARATATNQINLLAGIANEAVSLCVQVGWTSDTGLNQGAVSFGEDSTSTVATNATYVSSRNPSTNSLVPTLGFCTTIPAAGYHYYAWLEHGGGQTAVGAFFGSYSAAGGITTSGVLGTWRS